MSYKKIKKIKPVAREKKSTFPIVGIGASAGGLAAFAAFFTGMPNDCQQPMAFVLVQHLAPDHKSLLCELIKRYTTMQVYEVIDGMEVQPNCAYIIPPNRDMALVHGSLQLIDPIAPRGKRLPIDFFFRSLAMDQHENAICVVLSGTGSDGSLGVRAIKVEGGMAMSQNPESTEYDGMPCNAIATGLIDFVLPPAEMPQQIISYVAHILGKPPLNPHKVEPTRDTDLTNILALVRSQTTHDFSLYKQKIIISRIQRRMAVLKLDTMSQYDKYIKNSSTEVQTLFQNLLIGVTSFFRDPKAFRSIEHNIIPQLVTNIGPDSQIRIWIPACSTGEEAYTFAMLLIESQEHFNSNFNVHIFATDIDSHAIEIARAGLYPASVVNDISPDRLARFFISKEGGSSYLIHKVIRNMLVFSEQDVIKDPPFSKMDLISCRNLLIYMKPELQKKIIPLFHYALKPEGYLFLGTSETIGEFHDLYEITDPKYKIYQCRENICATQQLALGNFQSSLALSALAIHRPDTPKISFRELTEQTLIRRITPTAVLINRNGDILYQHGRTGMFLELSSGEATINNIIKMAKQDLRREIVTALDKAYSSHQTVIRPNLRVKSNEKDSQVKDSHEKYSQVNLTICPVTEKEDAPQNTTFYLVILDHIPEGEVAENSTDNEIRVSGEEIRDSVIHQLKQNLKVNQEYMQSTHEEMQTSNEELESSNEELQSVNEELQSTNEELETSKEELQSVNEELSTVNTELQSKLTNLSQANNDMNNLISGTGIGTVFVDHSLCIVRFTPKITQIINLISSDIGRPVAHIASNFKGYNSLLQDMQIVLDTLISKEVEVQTLDSSWYIMCIQPYRTLEKVIEGVVLTFVNITKRKQAESDLKETIRDNQIIQRTSLDGYIKYDMCGKLIEINDIGCDLLGYSRSELVKIPLSDIQADSNSAEVTTLLKKIDKASCDHFETKMKQKNGSIINVEVSVSYSGDISQYFIAFIRGISPNEK